MGRRPTRDFSKQERLTEPLVRENGELRPATWAEALDRAAAHREVGGRVARHPRRVRHQPRQRDRQRDHRGRPGQRGVHQARHGELRGVQGDRRRLPA